jgi:homoserine trans-succinylase
LAVRCPIPAFAPLELAKITGRVIDMIRTQVNLDKNKHDHAKRHPATLGISVAEFIRRWEEVHWMKYAGFVTTGDPASSQSIDELVYGTKD